MSKRIESSPQRNAVYVPSAHVEQQRHNVRPHHASSTPREACRTELARYPAALRDAEQDMHGAGGGSASRGRFAASPCMSHPARVVQSKQRSTMHECNDRMHCHAPATGRQAGTGIKERMRRLDGALGLKKKRRCPCRPFVSPTRFGTSGLGDSLAWRAGS